MNALHDRLSSIAIFVVFLAGCGAPPATPDVVSAIVEPAPPQMTNTDASILNAPPPALPDDPRLRAIVEEIYAKNAAVESYTCTWTGELRSMEDTGPRAGVWHEMEHTEQRAFKRPNLLHVTMTQVKHPNRSRVGLVWEKIVDGTTCWTYNHPRPDAAVVLADALKRMPEPRRAEIIQNEESGHVFKSDINALELAGVWQFEVWPYWETLLIPFHFCDITTLQLESENDDVWVFSAKANDTASGELDTMYVTIGKQDGILRKQHATLRGAEGYNVQTVNDLRLNVELPDTRFVFTPPEGVPVTDNTASE